MTKTETIKWKFIISLIFGMFLVLIVGAYVFDQALNTVSEPERPSHIGELVAMLGVAILGVAGLSYYLLNSLVLRPLEGLQRAIESPDPLALLESPDLELSGEVGELSRQFRNLLLRESIQRRELERMSLVASRTSSAVVIADKSGKIEWVNRGFEKITGYTMAEAYGKAPGSLLQGPSTDAQLVQRFRQCLKEGKPFHGELLNYHKSGYEYWIHIEVQPLKDASGEVSGFMALESDVTERRRMTDSLRESEQRFREMANSAPVGIWMSEEGTEFTYVNDVWCNYTGIPVKEHMGENWLECVHAEDIAEVQATMEEAFQKGRGFQIEARMRRHDGAWRWQLFSGAVRRNMGGQCYGFIGSSLDITDLKEANEQSDQLNRQLLHAKERAEESARNAQQANQAKSEFLANMSHEIRTPLNAILGFGQILNDRNEDPRLAGFLKTIQSSGRSLLALINDILDIAKVESGKASLALVPTQLSELCDAMLTIFQTKAEHKGLSLAVEYDETLPPVLVLDSSRVRQILLNLVGNAVKFTKSGEVRLQTRLLRYDVSSGEVDMQLIVSDTGPGIPSARQQRIFEAFTQQDSQIHADFGGTGLGLALCQRLVGMMGGRIDLESIVGEGSTFRVTLPKVAITKAKAIQSNVKVKAVSSFKPAKVVLADDVYMNRMLIIEFLKNTGLELIQACDGQETLDLIRQHQPEVVLLDMKMPHLDGYQVIEAMRAMPEQGHSKIIAVTASVKPEVVNQLKELCDGYLPKPLDRNELLAELSRHLEPAKKEQSTPAPEKAPQLINDEAMAEDIPALLEKLEGSMGKQVAVLKTDLVLDSAEAFARELLTLADKHNAKRLEFYAEELNKASQDFDIEKLSETLNNYNSTVEYYHRINT